MVGRLITASVFGLAVAAVACLVPMLVAGIAIPLRWAALLPAVLLGVNVLAFTFLLAALALASPMIGALQSLFTSLVLPLNGSFLPLALYPDWLAEVWNGGTLPWLLLHTLALTAVSGLLFVRNHRRALQESS
ncbi:hypothetical protein AB0B45_20600 [Nonomuraea sp. NPDC049152]|uniref:hypothetical protein n=1 Tax=Nonomuraea sp. NPDC049152 TaxID=3154350 RepID=UPI0033C106F0